MHTVQVVRGLTLTLAVSLGAHVAIAAAFLVPHRVATASSADPAPQLAGETFELPAPESAGGAAAAAGAAAVPANANDAHEGATDDGDGPVVKTSRAHGAHATAGRAHAAVQEGGEPSSGSSARYGATGDRSASDLATTFTRGFPQAASADPIWRSAPLGAAGAADVVLTLSAAGQIESSEIVGAPSPALASGIRRVIALIRTRPFTARGHTTKLHVTATVSSDAVHDGLHGDVFAIGGSFAGGEGNAFFALAVGRRIDLRVHQR